MKPKPVRAWVVVDPKGRIISDTVTITAQESKDRFIPRYFGSGVTWKTAYFHGYRVVRCRIVVEG